MSRVERFLPSGDEAGAPPGDRKFRPDVQGLRAVAVTLVVLFHAGVPHFGGGFVGVDVFFVISGFVITGVLLRERYTTGGTSVPGFYARRARRIIPAATLVIIVTVLASYHFLGEILGSEVAQDGKWAAVFLANFHFATAGTNYLSAQHPPSPLQNYWSLGVEEQFYIVYPALFILFMWRGRHNTTRTYLIALLVAVIGASFAWSILQTSSNPANAFFSPLTRAWELAIGALLAVCATELRRLPRVVAALAAWIGIGAVLAAAFLYTTSTPYPGAAVALPVLGTALVIGGGTARPAWGVEPLLRQKPFQWVGLISYSLYLWHWPIITIASERGGGSHVGPKEMTLLVLLSVALATVTYFLIENPVRHMRPLVIRKWTTIGLAGCLVGATLAVVSTQAQPPAPAIVAVKSGYQCPPPSASELELLRSTLPSSLRHPPSGKPVGVMLAGDSTACTLLPGLDALGPSYGLKFYNAAVVGCGIVSDTLPPDIVNNINYAAGTRYCGPQASALELSTLHRFRPSIVLWCSIWERSAILGPDGRTYQNGSAQWKSVLLQRMDARLSQFTAGGAVTVVAIPPPSVSAGPVGNQQFLALDALLEQFATSHPGQTEPVDLSERVCPPGPPCPYVVDGLVLRGDGIHYSQVAALWVSRWLVPEVLKAADNARATAGKGNI